MLANRQHFQIFPNSQRNWKLRWLSAEKESSDEQEGMKVGSWIFNPLRTVNLNIFFNLVKWIFYHFRRVDTDVSKNWMIMVMINWFKLLGPTEKTSPNFFNLKGDSVWSVTLGCGAKLSLDKVTKLCFGFVGGPIILIQVLVGPNSWGPTNHLTKIFKKSFWNKFPRKKVHISITNLCQFKCWKYCFQD